MKQILKITLSCLVGILSASDLCGQEEGGEPPVLEIGYSAKLFYDVDITDARAATKVWVERLIQKTGEKAGSETIIFQDLSSVVKAVDNEKMDLVILLPMDYLKIRHRVPIVPHLIASVGGRPTYEYVLLVHKDLGVKNLAQLQNRSVIIEKLGKGSIPWMWTETLLLKYGLPDGRKFFSSIIEVRKISRAVLPVFFGQADACIVPLDAFETMVELNPQLGENLTALKTSPGFCRVLICFSQDILERFGGLLGESLLSLHGEPQGQQILTLFHIDRLVPFEPSHLNSVVELVEEYEALKAGTGVNPN